MELSFHPLARDELEGLEESEREFIWESLEGLKDNPTPKNSGIIKVEGRELFKLKIKPGKRNGRVDHRVVYDIRGSKITVFQIFHRDQGYDIDEIEGRV